MKIYLLSSLIPVRPAPFGLHCMYARTVSIVQTKLCMRQEVVQEVDSCSGLDPDKGYKRRKASYFIDMTEDDPMFRSRKLHG